MRRLSRLGLALLLLGARAYAADVSPSSQWVVDMANTTILSGPVTVTTSSTALPASALAGRRRVVIQNRDVSVSMFIGGCSGTVVTTSNGLEMPAGSVLALELGPGVSICGIVASGTLNARVLELK